MKRFLIIVLLFTASHKLYSNTPVDTTNHKYIFKNVKSFSIKEKIYLLPFTGYNYYNKFMPGCFIYNSLNSSKKIEYHAIPFYSFYTQDLAGEGKLFLNITPTNTFQRVLLSLSAAQYALTKNDNFHRFEAEVNFNLKNQTSSTINRNLIFNTIYASDVEDYIYNVGRSFNLFHNFRYKLEDKRKTNPYKITIRLEGGWTEKLNETAFIKSALEAKYKFSYKDPKNGFSIRLFAGKFLYNNEDYYGNFNFRLSGWNGYNDYPFDHIFLARFENNRFNTNNNLLSQQFVQNDGGFALYSHLGQSNNWLITVNLSTTILPKGPLKIYTNIGTFADINQYEKSNSLVYEGGIEFSIIRDIFAIYLPVFMSNDLKETSDFITDKYTQKIRFTLNLRKLDIFPHAKQ